MAPKAPTTTRVLRSRAPAATATAAPGPTAKPKVTKPKAAKPKKTTTIPKTTASKVTKPKATKPKAKATIKAAKPKAEKATKPKAKATIKAAKPKATKPQAMKAKATKGEAKADANHKYFVTFDFRAGRAKNPAMGVPESYRSGDDKIFHLSPMWAPPSPVYWPTQPSYSLISPVYTAIDDGSGFVQTSPAYNPSAPVYSPDPGDSPIFPLFTGGPDLYPANYKEIYSPTEPPTEPTRSGSTGRPVDWNEATDIYLKAASSSRIATEVGKDVTLDLFTTRAPDVKPNTKGWKVYNFNDKKDVGLEGWEVSTFKGCEIEWVKELFKREQLGGTFGLTQEQHDNFTFWAQDKDTESWKFYAGKNYHGGRRNTYNISG